MIVELLDEEGNVLGRDQHDPSVVDLTQESIWSTTVFNTNSVHNVRVSLPGSQFLHMAEVVVRPCAGTTCPCSQPCNTLSDQLCQNFSCSGSDKDSNSAPMATSKPTRTPAASPEPTFTSTPEISTPQPTPASTPQATYAFNSTSEYCDDSNFFYYDGTECDLAIYAQQNGCSMECFENNVFQDCCGIDVLPDQLSSLCLSNTQSCQAAAKCCDACLGEAELAMRSGVLDLC